MASEETPKEIEFEDLANLSYEEALMLYLKDREQYRFMEETKERHILDMDGVRDVDAVVLQALNNIKHKLTKKTLEKIMRETGSYSRFPKFSKKTEFNGRQHRTGGGYYEEIIFLPDGITISSFVKKYGKRGDFRKSIELHKAMKRTPSIKGLVVDSPAHDSRNMTITYSHACFGSKERNLADKIKGKSYHEASEIIKNAIDVHLKLALDLTKHKKGFEKPFEEQVFTGQKYYFETIKSIDKIVDKALKIIAPKASLMEKRKIKGIFKKASGNDRLYVVPGDAQLANTVEEVNGDEGKFRICDFDYFNQASIHRILVRLLEKLGPAQLGEMDFVDYSCEKLCELEGKKPDENGKKKFRRRYLYEKPAENLLRAARTIEHIEQTPLGEDDENKKRLGEIALLYYNRAIRDFGRIGNSEIAWKINEIKSHPLLGYLHDNEYFSLEERVGLNDHGYDSMLLFQNIEHKLFNSSIEEEPFLRKAWNFIRAPVAIGIGASFLIAVLNFLFKSGNDIPIDVENYQRNPRIVSMLANEVSGRDFDYGALFNDFDGDASDKEAKVAKYLTEYLFASETDTMMMSRDDYNRFFGSDLVVQSHAGQIGQNWDTIMSQQAATQGIPPKYLRAVVHASSVKRGLNARAKNNGYLGEYVVMPWETFELPLKESYHEAFFEEWKKKEIPVDMQLYAASAAMRKNFGKCGPAEIFARFFAGNSAVDEAIKNAKSDDYEDFSQFLPKIAIELSDRAIAYFPFMRGDAPLVSNSEKAYSYAPLMEAWINNYETRYNTKVKRIKLPN